MCCTLLKTYLSFVDSKFKLTSSERECRCAAVYKFIFYSCDFGNSERRKNFFLNTIQSLNIISFCDKSLSSETDNFKRVNSEFFSLVSLYNDESRRNKLVVSEGRKVYIAHQTKIFHKCDDYKFEVNSVYDESKLINDFATSISTNYSSINQMFIPFSGTAYSLNSSDVVDDVVFSY